MILHPNVARKAHEELDNVLGGGQPTFADRDRMPYVSAIVKECLRWRRIGPFGEHCCIILVAARD